MQNTKILRKIRGNFARGKIRIGQIKVTPMQIVDFFVKNNKLLI